MAEEIQKNKDSLNDSDMFSYMYRANQTSLVILGTPSERGWSGGAKVLCILHHWGVQLILATVGQGLLSL